MTSMRSVSCYDVIIKFSLVLLSCHSASLAASIMIIICPIAVGCSMGQIMKSVCVCQCVRLWALSWSHFLVDFHQNWHIRKNPQK